MGVIHKDFPLPMDKSMRESPDKVRLVNSETKRNPTKLVEILERQGSMRSSLKFHPVDEDEKLFVSKNFSRKKNF